MRPNDLHPGDTIVRPPALPGGVPLHEDICRRLRVAIADGRLRPGDRVPPVRVLATQMGVARGTVDLAYAVLQGEGQLVAEGARGTFVAGVPPAGRRRAAPVESCGQLAEFAVGLPAADLFPGKTWSRLIARRARRPPAADLFLAESCGHPALREALASYLALARGIECQPEGVIVTASMESALRLVLSAVVSPGDPVLHEEPCAPWVRRALASASVRAVPVPVDGEGIDIEAGRRLAPQARLCIAMPAAQFPLGVCLSAARRRLLLDWAAREKAWIVEDGSGSEFADRRPVPASLKSLPGGDRVFHGNSFEATLCPGLPIAYVAPPPALAGALREACAAPGAGPSGMFLQGVVADFMAEGFFVRHLARCRRRYVTRRDALRHELDRIFGSLFEECDVPAGGLHIVARLRPGGDDAAIAARAQAGGFRLLALSSLYSGSDSPQGIVMGVANVAEGRVRQQVEALRATLG